MMLKGPFCVCMDVAEEGAGTEWRCQGLRSRVTPLHSACSGGLAVTWQRAYEGCAPRGKQHLSAQHTMPTLHSGSSCLPCLAWELTVPFPAS